MWLTVWRRERIVLVVVLVLVLDLAPVFEGEDDDENEDDFAQGSTRFYVLRKT